MKFGECVPNSSIYNMTTMFCRLEFSTWRYLGPNSAKVQAFFWVFRLLESTCAVVIDHDGCVPLVLSRENVVYPYFGNSELQSGLRPRGF